jgi:hypothetical protein
LFLRLPDAFAIGKANMPGLVRKILIFAAVDGLVLQPLAQRGQRPAPAAKIAYKNNSISPALKDGGEDEKPGKSFESFGIIGMRSLRKVAPLLADLDFYRTIDAFEILLPNLYYKTSSGSADTRETNLCYHGGRPDSIKLERRS